MIACSLNCKYINHEIYKLTNDRRVKVRENPENVGTSNKWVQNISTTHLDMQNLSTRWVPWLSINIHVYKVQKNV